MLYPFDSEWLVGSFCFLENFGGDMGKAMIAINKSKRFYKHCIRNRKKGAKICQDCPFREMIEYYESQGMREIK